MTVFEHQDTFTGHLASSSLTRPHEATSIGYARAGNMNHTYDRVDFGLYKVEHHELLARLAQRNGRMKVKVSMWIFIVGILVVALSPMLGLFISITLGFYVGTAATDVRESKVQLRIAQALQHNIDEDLKVMRKDLMDSFRTGEVIYG